MSQTTYSRNFEAAFAGMLGDSGDHRIGSYLNVEGSDIPAGILVALVGEGQAELVEATGDLLAGGVLKTFARDPGDASGALSGTAVIKSGHMMPVLEEGAVWLLGEEAMAVGDDVFVRFAAGAGGSQLGAVRNDADTASARQVLGARVLKASTGAGPVLVYLSVAVDTSHQA